MAPSSSATVAIISGNKNSNEGVPPRLNLVFDVCLTKEAVDFLFVDDPDGSMFTRTRGASPSDKECAIAGERTYLHGAPAAGISWVAAGPLRDPAFRKQAMIQQAVFRPADAKTFGFYDASPNAVDRYLACGQYKDFSKLTN